MAKSNLHRYSVQEGMNIKVAGGGYDIVAGGATVNTHTYCAITVLTGATSGRGTVSATSSDTDIWDTMTTVEVPEGCTIYGNWSAVTMGSGDIAIVYRTLSTD